MNDPPPSIQFIFLIIFLILSSLISILRSSCHSTKLSEISIPSQHVLTTDSNFFVQSVIDHYY